MSKHVRNGTLSPINYDAQQKMSVESVQETRDYSKRMVMYDTIEKLDPDSSSGWQALTELTHSDDELVRVLSLEALAHSKKHSVSAINIAADALSDDCDLVRVAALEALSVLEAVRVLDCVRPMVTADISTLVRCAAAYALGQIGSEKDARHLEQVESNNTSEQFEKDLALHKLRDANSIEHLMKYLSDKDRFVRLGVLNNIPDIASVRNAKAIHHLLRKQSKIETDLDVHVKIENTSAMIETEYL